MPMEETGNMVDDNIMLYVSIVYSIAACAMTFPNKIHTCTCMASETTLYIIIYMYIQVHENTCMQCTVMYTVCLALLYTFCSLFYWHT